MNAIIRLRVKEAIKSKGFKLFSIFGIVIVLFMLFKGEYSVNNVLVTEPIQIYGTQISILTIISSLIASLLSMNTIERERDRKSYVLLRVHGVTTLQEHLSYGISNALSSVLAAFALYIALIIYTLVEYPNLILKLFIAFIPIAIGVSIMAIIVTMISLISTSSFAGLLGIIISFAGNFKSLFQLMIENLGGLFATVMNYVFYLVPPLDDFSKFARAFMFDEKFKVKNLLEAILYILILFGLFYLLSNVGVKDEK